MAMITLQHNKELSAIFHQMANAYRYLGADHRFRAMAYETASRTLSNLQEPVDALAGDIRKLDELKGVGESIAAKIVEYLHEGRIATFEKLKKEVPAGLLDLMEIEGFGPATVKLLHEHLGIYNKDELADALMKNRLLAIPGIGAKKLENMRRVMKLPDVKQRLPLKEARKIGESVRKAIAGIPGVQQATLAGSLRRQKETVGDIDVVITANRWLWKRIIRKITGLPMVGKVLAAGQTKASMLLKDSGVQVDVRLVHPDEYGAALFYFTGSKEHNIQMRLLARQRGWKINEYGVFDLKTGKRLAGETEEGMYALFGMRYIPPEQRLGQHEVEQALAQ